MDRLVYLDNAATTFPKPEAVYRAIDDFQRAQAGNPGRSGHRLATAAQAAIDDARAGLARLIGAPDPDRIAFTLNATDALNMAIKGVVRPGDHAITSRMEHNSVVRPLQAMARDGRIALDFAANDGAGTLDPDSIRALLRPGTRLVAVTWASNAFGTIQPVREIAAVARAGGALLLLDASQAAGAIELDVQSSGADLVAFPGHKGLMGPMGTGALWVRDGLDLVPWREGGTGGDSTSPVQPAGMPHRLEGGTPNAPGLAGLGAGVRWVADRTVAAIRAHEASLVARLLDGLAAVRGVHVLGPARAADRVAAVSFRVPGLSPQEAAALLEAPFGIAVRPGIHCAPLAHAALGTLPLGTVRASLGPFSTGDDVDALVAAVAELAAAHPLTPPGA